MIKALRWIVACAVLLPLIVIAAVVALAYVTLEDAPSVARGAPVDYATVLAGKALLKRIKLQVESAEVNGTTLAVTEEELAQIAQMGSHTFDALDADINFGDNSIDSRVSLQLPSNPFGKYLNLGARIEPSSAGIEFDRLSLGPLSFSGRWLLPLAARMADLLLPNKQASLMLASVRELRLEGSTVLLTVLPPPDVKAQLKQAVRTLQESRFPPGEEERVAHYYNILASLGAQGNRQQYSLDAYLSPLIAEAESRSGLSSAVAENRAAIWALVIYFSNGSFEVLIGKLVSNQRDLVRSPSNITLGGRQDLMAHFLYSAGITLATQQGIGIAAGEFKELLDSGNGGSGFSFADLAADRAGIEFVAAATASESGARQLQQQLMANKGEAAFFPDIAGLAEGLSDAQFREQYGSVESARYRKQVDLIDKRISGLPVYESTLLR
jgi:hypothetical protein